MDTINDEALALQARLQHVVKKIADCVVLFEEAAAKMESYDVIAGQQIQKHENYFNKHLQEIKQAITELQSFMTETGAARLRVITERSLKEGQDHLTAIQEATEKFKHVTEECCQHLSRVSENSVNWIMEAIKSLRLDDFRRLSFENTNQMEKTSNRASSRIKRMMKWFHWEVLGIAVVTAIVAAFCTGLFINDESPIETHKQVLAERDAGKLLYKAWPILSQEERARIQHVATV